MSINQNNEIVFDGDGEPKKYKDEFKTQQFSFDVVYNTKVSPKYIVRWQIIKWIKLDKKDVLTHGPESVWSLYINKLVHQDTGLEYEPDDAYINFIVPSLIAIKDGEMFGENSGKIALALFDHTEVNVLKERSIFHSEFPKFFIYRQKNFLKLKERLIKKSMDS